MAIRFHLDEHIPAAVAAGLRRQGVDVTTTIDALLLGHADADHLAYAHAHGRVLVTHDSDFTRLHAAGAGHSGICFCHRNKYSKGELLRCLLLVNACCSQDEMRDHLEYL